jgi:hypothetical protein
MSSSSEPFKEPDEDSQKSETDVSRDEFVAFREYQEKSKKSFAKAEWGPSPKDLLDKEKSQKAELRDFLARQFNRDINGRTQEQLERRQKSTGVIIGSQFRRIFGSSELYTATDIVLVKGQYVVLLGGKGVGLRFVGGKWKAVASLVYDPEVELFADQYENHFQY